MKIEDNQLSSEEHCSQNIHYRHPHCKREVGGLRICPLTSGCAPPHLKTLFPAPIEEAQLETPWPAVALRYHHLHSCLRTAGIGSFSTTAGEFT